MRTATKQAFAWPLVTLASCGVSWIGKWLGDPTLPLAGVAMGIAAFVMHLATWIAFAMQEAKR